MLSLLLLADIFEALGPLIFGLLWVIWQVISAKQEEAAKKKAAEPVARAPLDDGELEQPGREQPNQANPDMRPPQREMPRREFDPLVEPQRPKPAPAAAGQDNDLRSEVDEFLRRLQNPNAEPKARPEPPRRKPPQRERRPRVEVVEEPKPRRSLSKEQRDDFYDDKQGESVGDHVSQHLGHLAESQLAEQAAHLGEVLSQTDERLEARLHEKFDNRLGKLGSRDRTPNESETAKKEAPAKAIAEMLKNPDTVRNAVILNEILTRPADRL